MDKNEKLSASVMEAVRSGHTIQAIKRLRAEKGLGLKEAKHIIDREIDVYRLANPNVALRQKSSPWPIVFVVVFIAGALYWYLGNQH